MLGQILIAVASAKQNRVIQAIAAALMVPVVATTIRAARLNSDLDLAAVWTGLVDPAVWLALGVTALFGALGGVVAELLSLHGRVELPHREPRRGSARRSRLADARYQVNLGILSRMLLGATAALAILAVDAPGTATALVVNALIAGSAATGVFRLVQGRMLMKAQAASQKPPRDRERKGLSIVGGTQATAAQ
jgi:hypothetical protein